MAPNLQVEANTQRLQALKFAYQILTDERNRKKYQSVCMQSKRTGKCMFYGDMLDTLDDIAQELVEGGVEE